MFWFSFLAHFGAKRLGAEAKCCSPPQAQFGRGLKGVDEQPRAKRGWGDQTTALNKNITRTSAGASLRWINLPRYIKWPTRPTSSASMPGKITNNTTAMNTQATDPVVGSCCAYIGGTCDIIAFASLKRLRARPAVARMPPRSQVFERGPEGEESGPAPKRGNDKRNPTLQTNYTPPRARLCGGSSCRPNLKGRVRNNVGL
jgi:hypothetical protein